MDYDIQFKRVYLAAEDSDGARVLVDRLWPRRKRREELNLDQWNRDAAPSPALRRRCHKDELDQEAFIVGYQQELKERLDCLVPLMRLARQGRLTLLTATRRVEQSHLPTLGRALQEALEQEDLQADGRDPSSPTCYDS